MQCTETLTLALSGGVTREFEIYKNSADAPGFRDYHERLQPFLLWYVDAASFIDVDDEKWSFYLMYVKQVFPTLISLIICLMYLCYMHIEVAISPVSYHSNNQFSANSRCNVERRKLHLTASFYRSFVSCL